MKIAGVREALEASKFALIQLIINPLIGRPQYLVAPPKTANSQWVSGLLFNYTPPSHHKSHHAHANALKC